MNPQKILILALTGAGNLGDDMIAEAEIRLMHRLYPTAHITVASYGDVRQNHVEVCRSLSKFVEEKEKISYRRISFFPNGIRKHPLKNIGYFVRQSFAMSSHDLIIIGGGGIFFDNEKGISFQKILIEWKTRLIFARWFRRTIWYLGISIEVDDPEHLSLLRGIFQNEDMILVRDRASQEKLLKIDLNSLLGEDMVFLNAPIEHSSRGEIRTIGISLRGGYLREDQEQEMVDFVDALARRGFQIIFLSHSLEGDIAHNDILYVQRLFSEKYPITRSHAETLDAYLQCDIVIAMRLHATILAAQHGIPPIILSYGSKTREISKKLSWNEYTIDTTMISGDKIEAIFSKLRHNYLNLQEKIRAEYSQIHTNCLQNIKSLGIVEE